MDAVADDNPGKAVSQAARIDRTSLAGPFQGIPVPGRFQFLTVLRYVERNALRAGLVNKTEE